MTKNSVSLTKSNYRTLPVPKSGRVFYYDDRQPGFALLVTSAGNRSFYPVRRDGKRQLKWKIAPVDDISVVEARKQVAEKINELISQQGICSPEMSCSPTGICVSATTAL